jgi:hypothetical protein
MLNGPVSSVSPPLLATILYFPTKSWPSNTYSPSALVVPVSIVNHTTNSRCNFTVAPGQGSFPFSVTVIVIVSSFGGDVLTAIADKGMATITMATNIDIMYCLFMFLTFPFYYEGVTVGVTVGLTTRATPYEVESPYTSNSKSAEALYPVALAYMK